MNALAEIKVAPVTTEDFNTQLVLQGKTLSLKMIGSADTRVMFPLESMMKGLEQEISRLGVEQVVVDMKELDFMNSSCFRSFVTWLCHVQEYEPDRRYAIKFLSDSGKHWQSRSLQALSCLALDLVQIEN